MVKCSRILIPLTPFSFTGTQIHFVPTKRSNKSKVVAREGLRRLLAVSFVFLDLDDILAHWSSSHNFQLLPSCLTSFSMKVNETVNCG